MVTEQAPVSAAAIAQAAVRLSFPGPCGRAGGRTEARQGRTQPRELRQACDCWGDEPVMLPCVEVPDLTHFEWTAARCPGFLRL